MVTYCAGNAVVVDDFTHQTTVASVDLLSTKPNKDLLVHGIND